MFDESRTSTFPIWALRSRRISSRNMFQGTAKRIVLSTVNSEVTIELLGGIEIGILGFLD